MNTKVKKKTFLGDTFEQLSDTGTSTAKQTVKAVKQTFDPFDELNQDDNQPLDQQSLEKMKEETRKKDNHTPLDLEKLESQYKDQDKQKEEMLRQRLFKFVKEGEEEAYKAKKQKEEERKKKEEGEEEEEKKKKKKKEKEKQDEGALPKGKKRRSIFSPKKKAEEQHAEFKPSSGQG